jgi:ribulose 1,5-bisphosphate synthetase/thiazole synthase
MRAVSPHSREFVRSTVASGKITRHMSRRMPSITPRKSATNYDVIVVGSGAAGAMAAHAPLLW